MACTFLLYGLPQDICPHVPAINGVWLLQSAVNSAVTFLGIMPTCVIAFNAQVLLYGLQVALGNVLLLFVNCAIAARVSLLSLHFYSSSLFINGVSHLSSLSLFINGVSHLSSLFVLYFKFCSYLS